MVIGDLALPFGKSVYIHIELTDYLFMAIAKRVVRFLRSVRGDVTTAHLENAAGAPPGKRSRWVNETTGIVHTDRRRRLPPGPTGADPDDLNQQ